jgi:hypothetical protein
MPAAPAERGAAREELSLWMKAQFEKIETEHQQRVEILRTAGEHPSPVFGKMVKRFAALGIVRAHIAKLLDVSLSTLTTHYADELELGVAEANAAVATNMLRIATDPSNPAAGKVGMAWLDRRGGEQWAPATKKIEVEDVTQRAPIIDSSKLTFAERQQMRAMLTRIADGGTGESVEDDEGGVIE